MRIIIRLFHFQHITHNTKGTNNDMSVFSEKQGCFHILFAKDYGYEVMRASD